MDLDINTPPPVKSVEFQSCADPFDLLGSGSPSSPKVQNQTNSMNLFEAFPPSSISSTPVSATNKNTELLIGNIKPQPHPIYSQPYIVESKTGQALNLNSMSSVNSQGINSSGISLGNMAQSQVPQQKNQSFEFSLSLNNGVFLILCRKLIKRLRMREVLLTFRISVSN